MLHTKARYFIEGLIHALFWAGVYYVLHSLTGSSFSMVVYNNGQVAGGVSASMLFPYPAWVLGALVLMFYGNILWLFKKLIRNKNSVGWILAVAGWFALFFAINYLVVRRMAVSASEIKPRQLTETAKYAIKTEPLSDTLATSIYDSAHHATVHLSPPSVFTPPPPPDMAFTPANWRDMQLIIALIFLAVLGVAVAYFFIKEWIRNDLARSHAEAQQYNTEIRFLRSQVNPHFLFNTLNNLFSMAQKKGEDELADGISKLSGMMRYMIYESNTERVHLPKEVEYLQDCITLNKLRYAGNEVSASFEYPAQEAMARVQVAPMLFIPFVENAFKHGVLIGRQSRIDISISVNQKRLIFICENSDYSSVKKLPEEKAGIGLENVKRRLQLVYPVRHILQAGNVGEKFIVKLQIELA